MECTLTKTNHGRITFYGVSCKLRDTTICFDDLSSDISAVKELCDRLERGEITEITLFDIIDDFMNT